MKRIVNYSRRACCLCVIALLLLLVYGSVTVPDAMVQIDDETAPRSIYTVTSMTVRSGGSRTQTRTYDAQVKLFRVLPVKRTVLTLRRDRRFNRKCADCVRRGLTRQGGGAAERGRDPEAGRHALARP